MIDLDLRIYGAVCLDQLCANRTLAVTQARTGDRKADLIWRLTQICTGRRERNLQKAAPIYKFRGGFDMHGKLGSAIKGGLVKSQIWKPPKMGMIEQPEQRKLETRRHGRRVPNSLGLGLL